MTTALRIGVDGRVLTDRYHGIGRVAFELSSELAALPDVELTLFLGPERSARFDVAALAARPTVRVEPTGLPPVHPGQFWRWPRLLRRAPIDVAFFPYHLGAPPFAPVPTLSLLHDCILEADRRFAPSAATRLGYRLATAAVTRTSTILTVSAASAAQAARHYRIRIPPDRVILNGVDQRLGDRVVPADELRAELGIPGTYLVHVGARRPHKNVGVLVEALAGLPDQHLVLVGSIDRRFPDPVPGLVARLGLADRVHHLPFVPERLLGSVYAHATALAYPSLVEGFGLPVLEAMVAGTPVVASAVPALAEIAGEAALLVPPSDPARWAAAFERLRLDQELRRELVARGRRNAARFTWRAAALRLVAAARTAAGR